MVKRFFRIICILVVISGLLLIIKKPVLKEYRVIKNNLNIDKFYNKVDNNMDREEELYIGILKIDKINLYQGFYDKNSKYNDIELNIMINKESDYPNVINGNLILMAHSGDSDVSYFRYLDILEVGDNATIYYKDDSYNYKLVKVYELIKNGKVFIDRDDTTTLTLITCSREKEDMQKIYIFNLI